MKLMSAVKGLESAAEVSLARLLLNYHGEKEPEGIGKIRLWLLEDAPRDILTTFVQKQFSQKAPSGLMTGSYTTNFLIKDLIIWCWHPMI